MKRYVLLLILTLPFFVQSQTGSISGRVLEHDTKEYIPFADVIVKSGDSIVAKAQTDFDGKYLISPISVGNYTIEFSAFTYSTVSIKNILIEAGKTIKLNTILKISGPELQEIELHSNMISTGSRNVKVVGSRTPGVQSQNKGAVVFKGARAQGNVYYVDGVKIKGTVNIPREAIEWIEILSNGLPSNYEGDLKIDRKKITEASKDIVQVQQYHINYFNFETYEQLVENDFEPTQSNPLSTFSIDVDGASYANARRYIMDGQLPPQFSIRIEEFINYFDYNYAKPVGQHPIALYTEYTDCPWNKDHKLLHVGLQAKDVYKEEKSPQNLVFLIDVSGSMQSSNKLGLVKKSLKMLVMELDDEDQITLVVYAGSSGLVLPPTKIKNKLKIFEAIDQLIAGGSTAGGAGIMLAYKQGEKHFIKNGNNRIILCTDGDFNVGITDNAELIKLIEEKRESGIYLSVLGFGTGNIRDDIMEDLSNHGNGNYYYIDNLLEAKKVLVHQLQGTLYAVAKDVKLQLEFNPSNVSAYRLIGYENRLLDDKDFNDDLKDAGEIGSGHTVTALYEIIPTGTKFDASINVDELKYQSPTNEAFQSELLTIKIRYKNPNEKTSNKLEYTVKNEAGNFNQSSDNFKFSASVAAFGMLIRGSSFSGTGSFDDVINWAKDGKGSDEYGYRAEFIKLVKLTQNIVDYQVSDN